MRLARLTLLIVVSSALVVLGAVRGWSEASIGQCVEYSPTGYCVGWDVPTPGGPAQPTNPGGGSGDAVTCGWQDISGFDASPSSLRDFGLTAPPPGVTVVWQTIACSDGSFRYEFRWVIPATPANLAAMASGRLEAELPQPVVASDPPAGTASIVRVPVFVEVTNWTGVVSQSECAAGLCVTVTATPTLTFDPGEPGAPARACVGSGSRYVAGSGDPVMQASAAGACAYAYQRRTGVSGRPSAWPATVSVTWVIGWVASTGETGALPSVTRATAVPRPVNEVQTVIVGGAGS